MTTKSPLEELFFSALAQPVALRSAFLDEHCRDSALRTQVELMLAAHSRLPGFLERGTASYTSDYQPETAEEVIAGKYRLRERIGEGGMGSVWLAEQTEPVMRKVAVKLIKPGMDSRQVLARFEAERQALALMDHPNIAKVLDGGSHDGRPYFVMELVKGVPITEFCDARKLTPKERLELFVSVCQAIQHAHQKGIIHRDIKPSNVLIALYDDQPVPKVIDFGVAKATGGALSAGTIETGFGGIVGTPQYMSPEQATFNNLDIDTRSDVYSLGVLLYELLTGSPPFSQRELEKKGFLEILRVVREEDPPRPSTKLSTADALPSLSASRGTEPRKLTGLLRNELDWIVMKALEKDRTRRYDTAHGFAIDVMRYLNGEAVQAHPPSRRYRIRKFVSRNRGQVIAASLLLFALLSGITGTTLGLLEARRQEQFAREEASEKDIARERELTARKEESRQKARAERARNDADSRYRIARDAFDNMVHGIQTRLGSRPGTLEIRKDLLEYARQGLQKLLAESEKQGQPDSTLVWCHLRLGEVEDQIGRLDLAEANYRAGLKIAGPLHDASPDNTELYRDLSHCHDRLGTVYLKSNRIELALQSFQSSLVIRERIAGIQPLNAQAQREWSLSLMRLGEVALRLNRIEESLEYYRKSIRISEAVVKIDPANVDAQRVLCAGYEELGDVIAQLNRTEEALSYYEKSSKTFERLAQADPANTRSQRDLGTSYLRLGTTHLQLNRVGKSLEYFRMAAILFERLTRSDPKDLDSLRSLAISYSMLGDATEPLNRPDEALEHYRKCSKCFERLTESDPSNAQAQTDLSISYDNLGEITLRMNRPLESLEYCQKSLKLRLRMVEIDPRDASYQRHLGVSYEKLGDVTLELNRVEEALDYFRKNLSIRKSLADADPANGMLQRDLGISYEKLGGVALKKREADTATDYFQQSLKIRLRLAESDRANSVYQRDLAVTYDRLGEVMLNTNRYVLALEHYHNSTRIRKQLAEADPENATVQYELCIGFSSIGEANFRLQNYQRALPELRKALKLYDQWKWPRMNPEVIRELIRDCEKAIDATQREVAPVPRLK